MFATFVTSRCYCLILSDRNLSKSSSSSSSDNFRLLYLLPPLRVGAITHHWERTVTRGGLVLDDTNHATYSTRSSIVFWQFGTKRRHRGGEREMEQRKRMIATHSNDCTSCADATLLHDWSNSRAKIAGSAIKTREERNRQRRGGERFHQTSRLHLLFLRNAFFAGCPPKGGRFRQLNLDSDLPSRIAQLANTF